MGWDSWSLWAPWGLFNWQVWQEKTTCLTVIWRPVPLKDFSSNLWRAFSLKWVVACKELTNFHHRFPGCGKKAPLLLEPPIWSSWKPSLLALRVSPSVYEGVSGKLVSGTKVIAHIRSWICIAALSCLIHCLVPLCHFCAPFLVFFTGETEASAGRWAASKSLRIWSPYLIGDPQVVSCLLSFQIAACACSTRKAHLEPV